MNSNISFINSFDEFLLLVEYVRIHFEWQFSMLNVYQDFVMLSRRNSSWNPIDKYYELHTSYSLNCIQDESCFGADGGLIFAF